MTVYVVPPRVKVVASGQYVVNTVYSTVVVAFDAVSTGPTVGVRDAEEEVALDVIVGSLSVHVQSVMVNVVVPLTV